MLIKAYGLYWNPDIIDWGRPGRGNKGELRGKIRIDGHEKVVDFWEAQGIYVLSRDFQTVYVGKAIGTPIGARIRSHLTDRLAGRWDMFSWFTSSTPRKTDGGVSAPGKRQISPETYIDTFEALAILIADPPLNRKRESFEQAGEVVQEAGAAQRTVRNYLEEILNRLEE